MCSLTRCKTITQNGKCSDQLDPQLCVCLRSKKSKEKAGFVTTHAVHLKGWLALKPLKLLTDIKVCWVSVYALYAVLIGHFEFLGFLRSSIRLQKKKMGFLSSFHVLSFSSLGQLEAHVFGHQVTLFPPLICVMASYYMCFF